MRSPAIARARRAALGLAAAAAVTLCAAPAASADFTLAPAPARASSAAAPRSRTPRSTGFLTTYRAAAPRRLRRDRPDRPLRPDRLAARAARALGESRDAPNPSGDRDPRSASPAPTSRRPPTQRQPDARRAPSTPTAQDVTAADNGKLHVIPVAIGAITIIVNLPTAATTARRDRARSASGPRSTTPTLEGMLVAGQVTTWGDADPDLDRRRCAATPIKRVVRLDSSGTTFALKQLPAPHRPGARWAGLGNTAVAEQRRRDRGRRAPADNGGGALRTTLDARPPAASATPTSPTRARRRRVFT